MRKVMLRLAIGTALAVVPVMAGAKELVCPGIRPGTGVKIELSKRPYLLSLTTHRKTRCEYKNDHWLLCNVGSTSVNNMYGRAVFAIHDNRDLYMGVSFSNIFAGATTPAQRKLRVEKMEQAAQEYGFNCSTKNNGVLPRGDLMCMTERPLLKCKEE